MPTIQIPSEHTLGNKQFMLLMTKHAVVLVGTAM